MRLSMASGVLPSSLEALVYLLPSVLDECVSKLPNSGSLILVLDGLEQLDDTLALDFLHGDAPQVPVIRCDLSITHALQTLTWLPAPLPARVRVVVGTRWSGSTPVLSGAGAAAVQPAELSDKQRAGITRAQMAVASKSRIGTVLSASDVQTWLRGEAFRNPMQLTAALQLLLAVPARDIHVRVTRLGRPSHEHQARIAEALEAPNLQALAQLTLASLEQQFAVCAALQCVRLTCAAGEHDAGGQGAAAAAPVQCGPFAGGAGAAARLQAARTGASPCTMRPSQRTQHAELGLALHALQPVLGSFSGRHAIKNDLVAKACSYAAGCRADPRRRWCSNIPAPPPPSCRWPGAVARGGARLPSPPPRRACVTRRRTSASGCSATVAHGRSCWRTASTRICCFQTTSSSAPRRV